MLLYTLCIIAIRSRGIPSFRMTYTISKFDTVVIRWYLFYIFAQLISYIAIPCSGTGNDSDCLEAQGK